MEKTNMTNQQKSVSNTLEKIISFTHHRFSQQEKDYIVLLLDTLYADGQIDGMKTISTIWEK
jgi:hypothetical protein